MEILLVISRIIGVSLFGLILLGLGRGIIMSIVLFFLVCGLYTYLGWTEIWWMMLFGLPLIGVAFKLLFDYAVPLLARQKFK